VTLFQRHFAGPLLPASQATVELCPCAADGALPRQCALARCCKLKLLLGTQLDSVFIFCCRGKHFVFALENIFCCRGKHFLLPWKTFFVAMENIFVVAMENIFFVAMEIKIIATNVSV
jgi:hypothetical protein